MTLKFLEKRLFDFAGRNRTMAEALSFSADKKNSQKIAIDTLIDLGADWTTRKPKGDGIFPNTVKRWLFIAGKNLERWLRTPVAIWRK